jgi:NAD+ synthase
LSPEKLCREIVDWLKDMVFSSEGRGAIYGLSGGLDSAVVALLCKRAFGAHSLALMMPCFGPKTELEHALLLAEKFAIPYKIINLEGVFTQLLQALEGGADPRSMAAVNIKPRLRMTALYYWSARKHYRVIGTGNKSEILTGYFTKHGDSGVDLEPLGDLLKEEVWALAAYLGVPREITAKKPTAGLWKGQTDETEMGFSYKELDSCLKGEQTEPALQEKIVALQQNSAHKRKMPPIFCKNGVEESAYGVD